jgi:hypothetical protein
MYGDTAFIWKADGGEGGAEIYSMAKVISDVVPFSAIWRSNWINQNDVKQENRVLIRYEKKIHNNPIYKTFLLNNTVLSGIKIFKQPQGTIFELTNSECRELKKIIQTT